MSYNQEKILTTETERDDGICRQGYEISYYKYLSRI